MLYKTNVSTAGVGRNFLSGFWKGKEWIYSKATSDGISSVEHNYTNCLSQTSEHSGGNGPLLVVEGEKAGDPAAELHSGFQIWLKSGATKSHVIDETLTACLLPRSLR